MTDREKLIEILRVPIYPHELADPAEVVADYLLDNGVTVQRRISVDERLPTAEDAVNGHVYAFLRDTKTGGEWPWEAIGDHPDWFTHWTRLPEPPKEVTANE